MEECIVQTFVDKIDEMDYHSRISREERIIPLYNVTFFVGAGFPKSINNEFPSGDDLFKFDNSDIRLVDKYDELSTFCRYCGMMNTSIDLNKFKSVYYRLQLMMRNPFLHGRFWDSSNLMQVDNQFRLLVKDKLDKSNLLKYVDGNTHFNQNLPEPIYHFFNDILHRVTEHHGAPAGIRNNFLTTNYDFMVESILDACSYDTENCGINTYRGFTPNLINGSKSRISTFENQNVIPVIKLNGGAEIYDNDSGYVLDYRKDNDFSTHGIAPELILPCQEQSYSSRYFQTIFPKAVRILQETDVLVIIGYSFPEEDGLVKFLLSQFAESECDALTKHLFYITKESDVDSL